MIILRSLLFVPGNQERRIEKALTVSADAIILDLEDSVPIAEKEVARNIVSSAITRFHAKKKQVFVRVNSVTTLNCAQDTRVAVAGATAGILLPKSENATTIKQAEEMIEASEVAHKVNAGRTKIVALVETPRGIINVNEIAAASPRVIGVAFGAEDYVLKMGVQRTREGSELYYPRAVIAVACHATGIMAFDTVYSDVKDTEGLIAETNVIKQMGFHGKMVIHPDQVAPVNQALSPSASEVAYARRAVEAFDAGIKQGLASVSLDGKMIDIPVLERARSLIARAEAISALEKS